MQKLIENIFGKELYEIGDVNKAEVILSTNNDGYDCIRNAYGYFPLSFVKVISVPISDEEVLDTLLTKNVVFLNSGFNKSCYLLAEDGTIDAVVSIYKNDSDILIEINEWDYEKVTAILKDAGCEYNGMDYCCLLIEGPDSMKLFTEELDIALEYMSFQNHEYFKYENEEVLIARTGYTGEFGYKIIGQKVALKKVLQKLADINRNGLVGMKAFQECMTEVKQPEWTMPLLAYSSNMFEIDYQWSVDFKKSSDYRGKDALYSIMGSKIDKNTVGALSEKAVTVGSDVSIGGEKIGMVINCQFSKSLCQYINYIMIDKEYAQSGFEFDADGCSLHTVSAPYVIPSSWSVGKEDN